MSLPRPCWHLSTSLFALTWLLLLGSSLHAQISLSTAVDLALQNSPRVRMAQADVDRAQAGLQQTRAAYVPAVVAASSALGDSAGFPLGLPTVFTISAQSLVFSYSQRDFIRAANSGLTAAGFSLKDVRQQVAEDTVLTYISLDRAQKQRAALDQQSGFSHRLETIVQNRLDAGQDVPLELTRARINTVQIRLQALQTEDEIASAADHLARLVGMPGTTIATVPESIPAILPSPSPASFTDSFAVQAALATARSKREQAFGDARYLFRPIVGLGIQYSRFSTYNNNYATYYPGIENQPNAIGGSLEIRVPLFDKAHKALAQQSMAEARRAEHEATYARDQSLEGQLTLQHSTAELQARVELAALLKDQAQQQLDVVLVQLQAAPGTAPPINPKDEQYARIAERQRYLDIVEADYQLRRAQINLLTQTGRLEEWLRVSLLSIQPAAKMPSSPLIP